MLMIRFITSNFISKFLAIICGIDAAHADHECIWCKYLKEKWDDMNIEWSITDVSKGAQTIEEILDKCTLGKQRKKQSCTTLSIYSNKWGNYRHSPSFSTHLR